jgi:uncharacterized protein with LGFP repeats
MLMRLVLVAALLFSGSGVAGARAAASLARTATSVSAATPAPSVDTTAASSGDVSMTEHDVVVPAVEPTGRVVESPDVVAAQHDDRSIVADKVVKADRIESAVVQTDTFQTLGVTWPKDAQIDDLAAQVRTRAGDKWSDWVPLVASDSGPDVNSADATHQGREGTDSVWVGDADAVQLSFAATAGGGPDGLSLVLIGSDTPTAPTAASTPSAEGSSATFVTAAYRTAPLRAATAAPRVISRSEWGARDQVCTPDVASKLVGAVVHHTAGSNDYSTVAEAEQQIRNDQSYHINQLGWCDIGYNFIVDKWGNIYEGRANSLTQPVIGVHAGGFNTGTVGISMLGDYSTLTPPPATVDAVAQIAAWRLGAYGVDPQGTISYYTYGGQNSKIPANTSITLPTIFAHRDVAYTACPGQAGYDQMSMIRLSAGSYDYAQRFAAATSVVTSLYRDMLGRDPDPAGLRGWATSIVTGTSAGQVAGYIAVSQEYASAQVRSAYRDVLRREPEAGGLLNWTNAVMGGLLRPEDLRGALIASDEYYINAGGTDAAYINALYVDILKRTPQPAEVAAWQANYLASGRGIVSHGVWKSLESAGLRVDEAYLLYLGRATDPTGRAGWAPVLQAFGEASLRSGIVDSPEFASRAIALY